MKPPKISVIVRIEQPGNGPGQGRVWERSITTIGSFPEHLAQQELFTIAHAQLHPARPPAAPRHD